MMERPIIFSAPMVLAILDGTKTQTRRLVKPQPRRVDCGVPFGDGPAWAHAEPGSAVIRCPYGKRGDRLWVRESFCDARQAAAGRVLYRASGDTACCWKPSIHMPRACSRIALDVTGVRVERLHQISRGDAMAEGCPFANMQNGESPVLWYEYLWRAINGPDSWDANPWVWVVEFRKAHNANSTSKTAQTKCS